jgi:hypothetical protein
MFERLFSVAADWVVFLLWLMLFLIGVAGVMLSRNSKTDRTLDWTHG